MSIAAVPRRQPAKALALAVLTVPVALVVWLVLSRLFGLSDGAATLTITVFFAWYWQIGWSFGGWPGNLLTANPWLRGALNWVLLGLLAWGSIALWQAIYDRPFDQTRIGEWAQTAIAVGVAVLFLFDNGLLPERLRDRQPLAGIVNVLFAIVLVPLAVLYLPQLTGGSGSYVPWVWFPLVVVVATSFAGWPFGELDAARAGIAKLGAVFATTIVFVLLLRAAGIDFFGGPEAATKGAIFAGLWTTVALVHAWYFNNWPSGHLPQPLKGLVLTATGLAVTVVLYLALVAAVPTAELGALLYGVFVVLWAVVSLAAPGLVGAWAHGHDADPGGAGVDRAADGELPSTVAPESA